MLGLPKTLTAPYRKEDKRYVARIPFLLNDSVETAQIERDLPRIGIQESEIFLGIAGFRSLDLLAQAGKDYGQMHRKAVLFDMNVNQVKAMNGILHLIDHAAGPEEFIKSFAREYEKWVKTLPRQNNPRQTEEDREFFSVMGLAILPHTAEEVITELNKERVKTCSWLHPGNFGRIKEMVERRDIETIAWDMSDVGRTETLAGWLTENRLKIGTAYLSSAPEFMKPNRVFDYYSRVQAPDANAKLRENLTKLFGNMSRILVSEQVSLQEQQRRVEASNQHLFDLVLQDKNTCIASLKAREVQVPEALRVFRYNFMAGEDVIGLQSMIYQDRDGRPAPPPNGEQRFAFMVSGRGLSPTDLSILYKAMRTLGCPLDEKLSRELQVPIFVIPSAMLQPEKVGRIFADIKRQVQNAWPMGAPSK